jgi:hypothetical protein
MYVCVCVLAFVIRHEIRIFSAPHYIDMCGLSGCNGKVTPKEAYVALTGPGG